MSGRLRGLGEPVSISHLVPPRVGNPAADEGGCFTPYSRSLWGLSKP